MHVNVETQMSYAVSQRANQSPTGLSECFLVRVVITEHKVNITEVKDSPLDVVDIAAAAAAAAVTDDDDDDDDDDDNGGLQTMTSASITCVLIAVSTRQEASRVNVLPVIHSLPTHTPASVRTTARTSLTYRTCFSSCEILGSATDPIIATRRVVFVGATPFKKA